MALREGVEFLFGPETVVAALDEREVLTDVPASMWRKVLATLEQLAGVPFSERRRFCARRPEPIRRLMALLMIDHARTLTIMLAKLPLPP